MSYNNNKAQKSDHFDNYSTNSGFTLDDPAESNASTLLQTSQQQQSLPPQQGSNAMYEKIIQDYVKIKSKLNILKKAYVDLSESAGQKDQTIRKYEQEIEGLSFRNQQMTTRVEMLQKEIDALKTSNNNSQSTTSLNIASNNPLNTSNSSTHLTGLSPYASNNVSSSSLNAVKSPRDNHHQNGGSLPPIEVLAEELEHKINENTTLHRSLNELEVEFRQKVAKTEQLLKQAELEKLMLEKKLESLEQSSKSTIEKLQNDKIKLELNVIQLENQLRESTHGAFSKNGFLTTPANPVQNNHSPVNVLAVDAGNLSKQLDTFVKSGADCLSKIYNSLGELRRFEKTSAKCDKSLELLRNHVQNSENNLDESLNNFYKLNHALINEMLKSLEVNNKKSSGEMEKLNKKLKIYLNKLKQLLFINEDDSAVQDSEKCDEQSIFNLSNILFTLFKFYFYQMDKSDLVLFNENQSKLESNLETLFDIFEKLLFVLNEKLPLEYSLNYSSKLTSADECLVSYLTQLKNLFEQFSVIIKSANIIELVESIRKPLISSSVSLSSSTSSLIINSPGKQKAEIENLKQTISKRESEMKEMREALEKNINELKFNLLTQEQKLKIQEEEIARLKVNKPTQAVSSAQIESTPTPLVSKNLKSEEECEKILEKLEYRMGPQTFEFYNNQIQLLNKKIQVLDSKSAFYHDEVRSLREQLKQQTDLNASKENELHEVRDQLERTRKSYEMQMSTMSDHLIEVNDRMTRQLDENERLKHELHSALNPESSSSVTGKNSKTKKSK
jgi:protein phosphatase 1 regulatory subunit 21